MSSEGEGFDRSMTDLMAGVAAVFLVIAVIFILRAQAEVTVAKKELGDVNELKKRNQKEAQRVLAAMGQLRTALAPDAGSPFFRLNKTESDLEVVLEATESEARFRAALFRPNQCQMQPAVRAQVVTELSARIGPICQTVAEVTDGGSQIEINLEGHSDHIAPQVDDNARCGVRGDNPFVDNVRLSAARAQELFAQLRNSLDAGLVDCLDRHFVVSGRGSSDPAVEDAGKDEALLRLNRRVVIKVKAIPLRVEDDDAGTPWP